MTTLSNSLNIVKLTNSGIEIYNMTKLLYIVSICCRKFTAVSVLGGLYTVSEVSLLMCARDKERDEREFFSSLKCTVALFGVFVELRTKSSFSLQKING